LIISKTIIIRRLIIRKVVFIRKVFVKFIWNCEQAIREKKTPKNPGSG